MPEAGDGAFECSRVGGVGLFDDGWQGGTGTVRELMHACAARWEEGREKRLLLQREMERAKAGKPMDWENLERKDRLYQALTEHGHHEEAARLLRGEKPILEAVGGTLESIIGGNEIAGIEFFERGLVASRAVARVEVPLSMQQVSYGSGVLVSRRLFLTNHHVVGSAEVAGSTRVQFEYLTTAYGRPRDPLEFQMVPDTFFLTNHTLDYTLVALEEVNGRGVPLMSRGWCPLIAQSGKLLVGERTNIIQHPGGERMKVAVRSNRLVCLVGDFLQYTTDTQKGSSGSPVFNDLWQLAAIHHMGVPKLTPDGSGFLTDKNDAWDGDAATAGSVVTVGNEGVRVSRIVADARAQLAALRKTRRLPAHEAMVEEDFLEETGKPPDAMNLWDLFTQTGTTLVPVTGSLPQRENSPVNGIGNGEVSVKIDAPQGSRTPFVVTVSIGDGPRQTMSMERNGLARSVAAALPHEDGGSPGEEELAGEDDRAADDADREAAWDDLDGLAANPGRPLVRALRRAFARATMPELSREAAAARLHEVIDRAADGRIHDPLTGERRTPTAIAAEGAALPVFAIVEGRPDDLHALFALAREAPAPALLAGRKTLALAKGVAHPVRCGALARAAFYVLLRDPGTRVTPKTVETLLAFHAEEPVGEPERRRHALIAAGGGGRNPFVDWPEIATAAFLDHIMAG